MSLSSVSVEYDNDQQNPYGSIATSPASIAAAYPILMAITCVASQKFDLNTASRTLSVSLCSLISNFQARNIPIIPTTTELAKERIDRHLFRFWKLIDMLENRSIIDYKFLDEIEEEDKIFPEIRIKDWQF